MCVQLQQRILLTLHSPKQGSSTPTKNHNANKHKGDVSTVKYQFSAYSTAPGDERMARLVSQFYAEPLYLHSVVCSDLSTIGHCGRFLLLCLVA